MKSLFLKLLGQTRTVSTSLPATIGEGTLTLPGFRIEARSGLANDRISIGRNSVLGCSIILERNVGTVKIGDNTYIGGGSRLICANQIEIGSDILIAWGCTIVDHDSHSALWLERTDDVRRWREGYLRGELAGAAALKDWAHVPMSPVQIKDKAWLGFNVIILKGVVIGEGAVVAAASVVTKDVPAWTLVAGNPARAVKELPPP